ncbi:TPA: TetR/AcrR family transcriptional regulator, partial [Klebsiella pneumoniae]
MIRRRGVNATSVREVVRYTDTPRGSIAHHFPRGKQELVEEALRYAGREVSVPLEKLVGEHGTIAGLRAFVGLWRKVLESTGYEGG